MVIGFFVLVFLYVWLRVEPALDYQQRSPVFLLTPSFFIESLRRPGGLLEYASAFLAQGDRFNGMGALIFTTVSGLAWWATQQALQRISGVGPRWASLVPPFLLLALRQQLGCAWPALSLGWLIAMAGAALPAGGVGWRLATGWICSGLIFYVAGLWPSALFAALVAGAEVLRPGRRWLALGCVLSASVGPVWMVCLPDTDWGQAVHWAGEKGTASLALALYLFPLLAGVVLALVPSPATSSDPAAPVRRKASPTAGRGHWFQRPALRRGLAAGLGLAGGVWIGLAFDDAAKSLREIRYYAARQEDQRVLDAARQLPTLSAEAEVRLHLALYRTGRLAEDLFSFAGQRGWQLLPSLNRGLLACRPQSETLFELGQVNVAEHFAHEALEHEGNRPEILRLLARINILKDRPQAARVFLNLLREMPFQQEWAGSCLRELAVDPRLPKDAELARIRAWMVTTDLPHDGMPVESLCQQALHRCRQNRMAFEYLMAHLLLSRELDKLVQELKRLDDFDGAGLPRHYEEAILLYRRLHEGKTVDLRGRQIRPETIRRFEQFQRTLDRQDVPSTETRRGLDRDFGDTFWHYYYFGKADQAAPGAARPMESL